MYKVIIILLIVYLLLFGIVGCAELESSANYF